MKHERQPVYTSRVAAWVISILTVLVIACWWIQSRRNSGVSSPATTALVVTEEKEERISTFFSPKGGARQALLKEVDGAKRGIRFAVYVLSDPGVVEALSAAARRGVVVEGVIDEQGAVSYSRSLDDLRKNGCSVEVLSGAGIMHNKFAIFDSATVATGSYNWSVRAEERNNENLSIIRDEETANKFIAEFSRLRDLIAAKREAAALERTKKRIEQAQEDFEEWLHRRAVEERASHASPEEAIKIRLEEIDRLQKKLDALDGKTGLASTDTTIRLGAMPAK